MSDDVTNTKIRKRAEKESQLSIDGIWVYGSVPQAKLSDFSRTIATAITVSNGDEIERLLNTAIVKLDQSVLQGKRGIFRKSAISSTQKYRETLQCIDDISVNLRFRQAQLLKDMKIFDDMSVLISSCMEELEIYIDIGKKRLATIGKSGEDEDWVKRFEGKISELEMSQVISLQSLAQLKLMKQNHEVLIEKLNTVLSNTIPLWRNQAAVEYGIEKYEDSDLVQKKVIVATEKITRENEKNLKRQLKRVKKSVTKEVDIDRIKKLNSRLEASLEELKMVELDIRSSTEKMDDILWKVNEVNKPIKLKLQGGEKHE